MRHSPETPADQKARGGRDVSARQRPARRAAAERARSATDSVAADAAVEKPVEDALRAAGSVILAVSGGRDSMALLHAAARVATSRVRAVATFDHATGPHAAAATALVADRAAALGLVCVQGLSTPGGARTEAAWRESRWRFLREVAVRYSALPVTAHTRDDQLETILIRLLRHAGARGLAGLDVSSEPVHPWLRVPRHAIADYAERHGLRHVEDPSNATRVALRNRVRLDLLPALRRVRPTIDRELLAIGRQAAAWRRAVERVIDDAHPVQFASDGASVAAVDLDRYDAASLAIVWPVLAARAGVTLDRRGTVRLVAFTNRGQVGGTMQLSGGFEVRRSRFSFVIRRTRRDPQTLGPPLERG